MTDTPIQIASDAQLEILEHYGIKGMKWGVRRDRRTLDRLAGRTTSKGSSKKTTNSDKNQTKKAQRRADVRNRRNLSDRDIRGKIDRLKLERELSKLTAEDLSPIRSKVTQMLSDAGWQVGKNVSVAVLTVLTRKYLAGETLTREEIGKYLRPKK